MKRYLTAIIFLLIFRQVDAQQQWKPNPLMLFFQQQFDSTIIYHTYSNWYFAPHYNIVTQINKTTHTFSYKNPYCYGVGGFRNDLAQYFINEHVQFLNIVPDTNRYLLPYNAKGIDKNLFWVGLSNLGIWQLSEYNKEGDRCSVSDGSEEVFYLINKKTIRRLYFYDPAFYELECEPGNMQRQIALKIISEMKKLFD